MEGLQRFYFSLGSGDFCISNTGNSVSSDFQIPEKWVGKTRRSRVVFFVFGFLFLFLLVSCDAWKSVENTLVSFIWVPKPLIILDTQVYKVLTSLIVMHIFIWRESICPISVKLGKQFIIGVLINFPNFAVSDSSHVT